MTTGALSLFNYLGIVVVAINVFLAVWITWQIVVEARTRRKTDFQTPH